MTDDDLRYELFAMTLPAEERRQLGRLLEMLVTRDEGGWTIPDLTADQFLARHRKYLITVIETEHGEAFHADD